MQIEYATAAAGAMCVIDWNRTCGSPIECVRKRSKERDRTAPASIGSFVPLRGWFLTRLILPGRRIPSPAPAQHRGDDVDGGEVLRLVGVAVEYHEVGEVARQQPAAAVLVARQPRGIDGRGR